MVAQCADEHARKADGAAQGLCRGHPIGIAVDEVGKDDAQKALGAVQDAAERTGEHRHGDVVEGVLGRGLPQAQYTALGKDFPFREGWHPALEQGAAQ